MSAIETTQNQEKPKTKELIKIVKEAMNLQGEEIEDKRWQTDDGLEFLAETILDVFTQLGNVIHNLSKDLATLKNKTDENTPSN